MYVNELKLRKITIDEKIMAKSDVLSIGRPDSKTEDGIS
jgi:hypothetical protein